MTWCENNVVDYILGLPRNVVLDRLVEPAADDIRVRRPRARPSCSVALPRRATRPSRGTKSAGSWHGSRRAPAMRMTCCAEALISATSSLRCRAAMLSIFMKRSTAPVDRPRTSSSNTRRNWRPIAPVADRRSPTRCRLILHTGAYWLLLDLRAAIPSRIPLRQTEFTTIRLRLLKIAGRIIETASRIRIALASCCPEAETFSLVAIKLQPSGP